MKNLKILIVDDEPDILDSFAFCLRKYRENLLFAYSGNNAISILKNYKVDVIFSDFKMADGSGAELQKYVKEHHKNIDFYFLSGNQIEHLVEEDFIKGIFSKPRDIGLMMQKIMELMGGPKE